MEGRKGIRTYLKSMANTGIKASALAACNAPECTSEDEFF